MLANFQKTFNPTEQDKEERTITWLKLLINLIKDKDCVTCKHCVYTKEYEHGNETSGHYCGYTGKLNCDTCDLYEVDEDRFKMTSPNDNPAKNVSPVKLPIKNKYNV